MAQKEEAEDDEKLASMKEKLLEPKGMAKSEDGKEYPVCILEIETKKIRNAVTSLLHAVNPEAWKQYKDMKTADGSLKGKRKAYSFAFTKLLDVGFNISGLVVTLAATLSLAVQP
ncbi:MAG TPA: hypothetical protein VGP72_00435 [Planctomycetota bacterium]|jgi:hypothetical protein